MLLNEKFLLISVKMSVINGGLYFLVCVTIVLCRPNIESRIVGGTKASLGAFPYQVSIREDKEHVCGGSVISKKAILTAAHCIYNSTGTFTVVTGANQLNCDIKLPLDCAGQTYNVETAIYHDDYSPVTAEYDVAVLKLKSEILLEYYIPLLGLLPILGVTVRAGPRVRVIQLADSDPSPNTTTVLSGWGLTSYPGTTPNDLQQIKLKVFDLQTCQTRLQGYNFTYTVTSGNACTTSNEGFGACTGDSGGPLVLENGVQVGIVSWVVKCARGDPDVFTSVAFFKDWIKDAAGIVG